MYRKGYTSKYLIAHFTSGPVPKSLCYNFKKNQPGSKDVHYKNVHEYVEITTFATLQKETQTNFSPFLR